MTDDSASRSNVDSSRDIGLTAYLTPRGKQVVTELLCKNGGYEKYRTQLTEAGAGQLATIRLATGIYDTGFGSCHFHGEAQLINGQLIRPDGGFSLGYAYVVRIESDNGDVWQNRLYDESGVPKDGYEPPLPITP